MLNILISILGMIITIFVIVGVHEFGHFIVARTLGIKVLKFSIGFGKALYRWHDKKGTEYVLAAIPLGGYVKMLDETEGDVKPEERPYAYNHQPFYKKIAVIFAGPLFNFILAFILYWILFFVGFSTIIPVIGEVTPQSIAAQAGLAPQDEIQKVNNHTTLGWMGVVMQLFIYTGDKNQITMDTKNLKTQLTQQHIVDLTHWHMDDLKPDPLGSLGIVPYVPDGGNIPKNLIRFNQFNFVDALVHAKQDTVDFIILNFLFVGKLLTGKISLLSLGGPITIFESAGVALNNGILPFLSFLSFLSIAIGVVNVLPIPGLDGGHLLIHSIEAVIRRPISQKMLNLIFRLGFIILLLLLIQAISNDIMRL